MDQKPLEADFYQKHSGGMHFLGFVCNLFILQLLVQLGVNPLRYPFTYITPALALCFSFEIVRTIGDVETSARIIKQKFYGSGAIAMLFTLPTNINMIRIGQERAGSKEGGPWFSRLTLTGLLMMFSCLLLFVHYLSMFSYLWRLKLIEKARKDASNTESGRTEIA